MFNKLTSFNNLLLAYKKASKGKRGKFYVAQFEHELEENVYKLRNELIDKTYKPGKYNSFFIHEPKRRLISAAPFKDRVIHHALCNITEPLFERSFIDDSFANRKGKGTHKALDRCQQFARKFRFALQCDIKQFFPSIDHEILKSILASKIYDANVSEIIDKILHSGKDALDEMYDMVYFPGDDLFSVYRARGLPIGNLTSQFWANVYLNSFDHFVKRELGCKGYLRYVDDFILFADDKKALWQWKKAIVNRLKKLRLTMHPNAHPRPVTEGLPFLGFHVFPSKRRLKRRKGVHFQRKLKQSLRDLHNNKTTIAKISASVQGWTQHLGYANTIGLRKSILSKQSFRL